MLQKIKSLSLERQLFLSFSAVSALLLMLSLGITLYFDIARQSQSIDSTISSTAASQSASMLLTSSWSM